MATRFVHTCVRVLDPDKSAAFYEALGFERRGKLQFQTAYNIYMGLPGDGLATSPAPVASQVRAMTEATAVAPRAQ